MKNFNYYNLILAVIIALPVLIFSPQGNAEEVMASGTFTGASNHTTTGGVSVIKTADGLAVVLGSDFAFDGAPDPKVGFGKSGKYDIRSQLAHLQSDSGEQSYPIPEGIDISGYNEIYIWCEKYSVPLGVATIK